MNWLSVQTVVRGGIRLFQRLSTLLEDEGEYNILMQNALHHQWVDTSYIFLVKQQRAPVCSVHWKKNRLLGSTKLTETGGINWTFLDAE